MLGNYEALNEDLSRIKWEVMKDRSVEDSWLLFGEKLHCCRSKQVPHYRARTKLKLNPPRWNRELEKNIKEKHQAFKNLDRQSEKQFKRYIAKGNQTL